MPRRNRHTTFSSRCARGWRNLRLRWRTANKIFWMAAFLGVGIVAVFASALHSVHVAKVDQQSLRCLALNIYYEARGEPKTGQYAVAEVTMNRVAARHYPATVCAVVYQQNWDPLRKRRVGAFSWTELKRLRAPEGREWQQALEIAAEVYYRRYQPLQLADALHYHADYVEPSWSRHLTPVARIGNHIFYR